ncbi:PAS and helix-turn-helix domain-containing protein [Desulforhopalus sp. IMCC35007]|uniref:PAS and helix-turn-helix domain-containing protein n=1 Tax=Desulforhopalus sp. IMCC35007 TaxID=2569543 RepID=UPI0010AE8194|nr:PAS and helix-turn-helix domain-containing protein [Desulforhopalus sp. IMCC35007]TKB07273.1 helix-turn-helix transcriptional regulator [Desulforhopalus sp. IMCC35007]
MLDPRLYQVIVDSMSAHVAILDEQGVIIETNRAWQAFALENGMKDASDSVGVNYLKICDGAGRKKENDAIRVADGIRKVLAGELPEFLTHYPCHSPEVRRWFAVRVVPFRDDTEHKVIVTHENITPIIEVQEALEKKEVELRRERERLEETNIALRVLLRQRDEDKTRIEETIYINVDRLVLPYVEKLLQGRLTEKQRTLTEVIDTNLRDIVSPFLRSLTAVNVLLTPQEIEVANMVRSGRTSKDIADVLGISASGVDFHRKRLRQKLGLTNTAKNLRSFLLSLESDG